MFVGCPSFFTLRYYHGARMRIRWIKRLVNGLPVGLPVTDDLGMISRGVKVMTARGPKPVAYLKTGDFLRALPSEPGTLGFNSKRVTRNPLLDSKPDKVVVGRKMLAMTAGPANFDNSDYLRMRRNIGEARYMAGLRVAIDTMPAVPQKWGNQK